MIAQGKIVIPGQLGSVSIPLIEAYLMTGAGGGGVIQPPAGGAQQGGGGQNAQPPIIQPAGGGIQQVPHQGGGGPQAQPPVIQVLPQGGGPHFQPPVIQPPVGVQQVLPQGGGPPVKPLVNGHTVNGPPVQDQPLDWDAEQARVALVLNRNIAIENNMVDVYDLARDFQHLLVCPYGHVSTKTQSKKY